MVSNLPIDFVEHLFNKDEDRVMCDANIPFVPQYVIFELGRQLGESLNNFKFQLLVEGEAVVSIPLCFVLGLKECRRQGTQVSVDLCFSMFLHRVEPCSGKVEMRVWIDEYTPPDVKVHSVIAKVFHDSAATPPAAPMAKQTVEMATSFVPVASNFFRMRFFSSSWLGLGIKKWLKGFFIRFPLKAEGIKTLYLEIWKKDGYFKSLHYEYPCMIDDNCHLVSPGFLYYPLDPEDKQGYKDLTRKSFDRSLHEVDEISSVAVCIVFQKPVQELQVFAIKGEGDVLST